MKRLSGLYAKIISLENLDLADRRARAGKTRTRGVMIFDKDREYNLLRLHEALLTKTFHTSNYDYFTITEPKERLIARLPYYPDRIVHHALMNVLEPIWTATFTFNTYSCIKGRGIQACADQVRRLISKHSGKPLYCLKLDIRKFYPTLDHDHIKAVIRRRIKDSDLLWLLDEIIDSQPEGLPIGNYISAPLANLALSPILHTLNEREHVDVVEYADDIVIFAECKERLCEVLFSVIVPYVENVMHQQLKPNWQIFPVAANKYDRRGRGVDFVGYVFYRTQTLVRKSIKRTFCRKVSRLKKFTPPLTPKQFKMAVAPWLGWAKHSNARNLLQTIIPNEYKNGIL